MSEVLLIVVTILAVTALALVGIAALALALVVGLQWGLELLDRWRWLP